MVEVKWVAVLNLRTLRVVAGDASSTLEDRPIVAPLLVPYPTGFWEGCDYSLWTRDSSLPNPEEGVGCVLPSSHVQETGAS